jgi:hypothetical protein
MQMVMMTFRSSLEDTVVKWLEAERRSFTFLENAHGKGTTENDLRANYRGGSTTLLLAGIPDEELSGFRERILDWQRKLSHEGTVPIPVHVFVLPCIMWF